MTLRILVADIIEQSSSPLLATHESWGRVGLGLVAEILNGFAFSSARFSDEEGTPLIRIRNILTNTTETFYQGDYDDAYLVYPGDLLIGMDGDFNITIWRGPVGLLNQRVCKVEVDSEFYNLYFSLTEGHPVA